MSSRKTGIRHRIESSNTPKKRMRIAVPEQWFIFHAIIGNIQSLPPERRLIERLSLRLTMWDLRKIPISNICVSLKRCVRNQRTVLHCRSPNTNSIQPTPTTTAEPRKRFMNKLKICELRMDGPLKLRYIPVQNSIRVCCILRHYGEESCVWKPNMREIWIIR